MRKKTALIIILNMLIFSATSMAIEMPGLIIPRTKARQASSSDQSIISGKLTAANLEYVTFIISSPFTDFSDSVNSLTLLPGGKVQSNDVIVNRWEVGEDNSLRFFLVEELRAVFRYRPSEKALIAEPIIAGKQAYIRLRISR